MNEKVNKKGFTLAELLIVVAIIAVLVAISIPIFNTQLEKSREATDLANVRNAYAMVKTAALSNDVQGDVKKSSSTYYMIVDLKQQQDDWQMDSTKLDIGGITNDDPVHWLNEPKAGGFCKVSCTADGETYINWDGKVIAMQVVPAKADYAHTLNVVLNTLKNEVVEQMLMSENKHVSYIQFNKGLVTEVKCYANPSDNGNRGCTMSSEQLSALNSSIQQATKDEPYKLTTDGVNRVFFDWDGNVISGRDENGKTIGIGGQGANANIWFSDNADGNKHKTNLDLKSDIWE